MYDRYLTCSPLIEHSKFISQIMALWWYCTLEQFRHLFHKILKENSICNYTNTKVNNIMSILTTMMSHDDRKNYDDITCTVTSAKSKNREQQLSVSFKDADNLTTVHAVVNLKRSLTRNEHKLLWAEDPSRRKIKRMLKEQKRELDDDDEKECSSSSSSPIIKRSQKKRLVRRLHFYCYISFIQINHFM